MQRFFAHKWVRISLLHIGIGTLTIAVLAILSRLFGGGGNFVALIIKCLLEKVNILSRFLRVTAFISFNIECENNKIFHIR